MSLLHRSFIKVPFNFYNIANYSTRVSNSFDQFIFKSNFTNEEQSKILNTLNKSDSEQLTLFNVSQVRIKNLESWRNKNGLFKSLNEVLEVEGLGEKVLERICKNIISENVGISKSAIKIKVPKQMLSPPLDESSIKHLKSAVGIHLGPTGVSWAKLSKEGNKLDDLDYLNFIRIPIKLKPNETFNLAISILNKLPVGDVYILEANSNTPQSQAQTAAYTQQLELGSMLLALLNTSCKHNLRRVDEQNKISTSIQIKVFYLRSKIPARLFRTLVGNERVSAVTAVSELINETCLKNDSLSCSRISVDCDIKTNYNLEAPANKELLGQALMLAVSFMDLCIYNNSKSFAAIASRGNSKH